MRHLIVKYKNLDIKKEYFKKEKINEKKKKKFQKKGIYSLSKLSLFQKTDGKFNRSCPLSVKNAPIIDYKNISLIKKIYF